MQQDATRNNNEASLALESSQAKSSAELTEETGKADAYLDNGSSNMLSTRTMKTTSIANLDGAICIPGRKTRKGFRTIKKVNKLVSGLISRTTRGDGLAEPRTPRAKVLHPNAG